MLKYIGAITILATALTWASDDDQVELVEAVAIRSSSAQQRPNEEQVGSIQGAIESIDNPLQIGARSAGFNAAQEIDLPVDSRGQDMSLERFKELLKEYVDEAIPWGRQSTFSRNALRATTYAALFVAGTVVVVSTFTMHNSKTFTSCNNYQDVPHGTESTFFQTAHAIFDFSNVVNTSIYNTTTNTTQWFYRVPQLCSTFNFWSLTAGVTGGFTSLVGVLGLCTTRPILSNESFNDMMADIYMERQKIGDGMKDEHTKDFFTFSTGRYYNYFNANGPFNKEAFASEVMRWRAQ